MTTFQPRKREGEPLPSKKRKIAPHGEKKKKGTNITSEESFHLNPKC